MAIGGGRTPEEERAYYADIPVYTSLDNADTSRRARVGNTIYEYNRGAGDGNWTAIRTSPEGTYPQPNAPAGQVPGLLNPLPPSIAGGILGPPTQGGGGYTSLNEYIIPPTYSGPATIDPYVMQSSMGPGWDYQYPVLPNGLLAGASPMQPYGPGNFIPMPAVGIPPGATPITTPGTPPGQPTPGPTPGTNPATGAKPGSDKDKDIKNGRIHHKEMYDEDDMWVGAEGAPEAGGTRSVGPLGNIQGSSGAIESRVSAYDPTNAESADEAFNVNEFSYSPTGTALNSFQNIGLIGNLPGQPFSPLGQELERVRIAEEQAAAANDLSFTGYNEAVRQSNLARQATDAAQRFQNAMPEMTTPVAEMVNAKTVAENTAKVQALAGLMSGGPNYSNANNAAINAVMQPQLDLEAQQRYMTSLDDEQARNMRAMAQGRNLGEAMRQHQIQQIANEWAGGSLLGEFDGMPEIETNVDVGGTRGSATGGFGRE